MFKHEVNANDRLLLIGGMEDSQKQENTLNIEFAFSILVFDRGNKNKYLQFEVRFVCNLVPKF